MYVYAIYYIVLYLYTLTVPCMCILIWCMLQKLIHVEVQRLSICRLWDMCAASFLTKA